MRISWKWPSIPHEVRDFSWVTLLFITPGLESIIFLSLKIKRKGNRGREALNIKLKGRGWSLKMQLLPQCLSLSRTEPQEGTIVTIPEQPDSARIPEMLHRGD